MAYVGHEPPLDSLGSALDRDEGVIDFIYIVIALFPVALMAVPPLKHSFPVNATLSSTTDTPRTR